MKACRIWIILIYSLLVWSTGADYHPWVLYSKDSTSIECFMSGYRRYCRSIIVNDSMKSCRAGDPWTFHKLKDLNVTSENLIDWLIPFHLIEQYTGYLNYDENNHAAEAIICNCSQNRIGRKCEYSFNNQVNSPGDLLARQISGTSKNNYETLTRFIDGITCKGADIFLEWRHICDGITQCQNGADEIDCHYLEFHKCELDEFQCRNGMCIPIEFAFDAAFDCMDGSDEQQLNELYKRYYDCSRKSTMDCDDRLCHKDQFSCGNGECVPWSSVLNHNRGCENSRHSAYICETYSREGEMRSEQLGICKETIEPILPLTNISDCLQTLRYLLQSTSDNLLGELAVKNMKNRCENHIIYSEQNAFFPGLKVVYNRSRIEAFYSKPSNARKRIAKAPDLYYFSGDILCDGISLTVHEQIWFNLQQLKKLTLSYPFFPLSHLICEKVMNKSTGDRQTYKEQVRSLTSSSYYCKNTSDRISLRRINDGYIDCLYGEDERNPNYPVTELFRYRCQTVTSPYQYVSYSKLGDGVDDCADGSDEISKQIRWPSFKCDVNDAYACWVFQGDQFGENRIKDARFHYHRHCDSIWDSMDGQDEKNCLHWICDPGLYKCNRTGQCIELAYFCDGEFDCDDGEDEINCSTSYRPWDLEIKCNKTTEFFCITNKYVENQILHRPCIHRSQVGDGHVDCVGARDERNIASCPDHRMVGDRFLCDNGSRCIHHMALCNGIKDCADETDESICYWNAGDCYPGQFPCADRSGCKSMRCSYSETCTDKSHRFWCRNINNQNYIYRSDKDRLVIDNKKRCYNQLERRVGLSVKSSSSDHQVIDKANESPVLFFYCNRGFYLRTPENSKLYCFCPQTFYGDRCQFSSRRVAVHLRFDRKHRLDLPIILNVLISLILNDSVIVDHLFSINENKEYPSKMVAVLVYPRPKPQGIYSVRIEAYHSTEFIHFWQYPVSPLDFLPVLRIAKILRFPNHPLPWFCPHNYCQNNGTCYQREENRFLCICSRNWNGKRCETRSDYINCSPSSLARTENICVCPYGYLGPYCYVENFKCERIHCSRNETCIPASNSPIYEHICICNASDCTSNRPVISLNRLESNEYLFLLQLLQLAGDYPTIRQQILIPPLSLFPLVRIIKTRDFRDNIGLPPEIGLLFTFKPNIHSIETTMYLLFINCSNTKRNFSVDLDLHPQMCHTLSENHRNSATLFLNFCQNSTYGSCFTSDGYLCYCGYPNKNQSNCVSYQRRYKTCNYCQNQGHCVQGDLTNKSDFACVCPKCVTGVLCQFSPSRFSISLEFLIEKTNWFRKNFIGPSLFLLMGIIFNGLSIIIFVQRKLRQTGIGLHLLSVSVCSLLVLILLFSRVTYLYVIRRLVMKHKINMDVCKSLPFLMYTFYYASLWLMAIITVERALAAIQYSRWSLLQKSRAATVMISLILLFVLSSNYIYIDQYKLVNHPDYSFPWCIREIPPSQQLLTQILSLIHQMVPFMVNLVAASIIIITITRSKAHVHKKTIRITLMDQTRKRLDLLLGPITCFLTQLPEIIILFLNACDYDNNHWFSHVALVTHYISFAPHMSIFFLYVLPSKHYREIFLKETSFGQHLSNMIYSTNDLPTRTL